MRQIEGRLKHELRTIVEDKAPREAVGLILKSGQVLELTNYAPVPEKGFEVSKAQILKKLQDLPDLLDVIFWHSHPAGGVGPSATDLKHKTPFSFHLVVTLVEDDIVATWY